MSVPAPVEVMASGRHCGARMTDVALIALAACLSACSSASVLIRQDDPTFSKAQEQLQRTAVMVDALAPAPAERGLFLQAESFYQYRFARPPRSTASVLAEVAAATTDFPGFQALAGSLDLVDLRYRAPDSAVQLWETLLDLYPQTSLRPVTLYRLGWAYRNTGVQGLPRSSSEAFDQLISEQPGSLLAGFAAQARTVAWKSKQTASLRSLIPGVGQFYVGKTRSGLIRLGVAAAALIAVAAPLVVAAHDDEPSELGIAAGVVGLIVLSFDYTSSYQDALRGAVRFNERAEADFNQTHPAAP